MNPISSALTMSLDGGNPSLDFVNSGYDRERGKPVERLHAYDDLLVLSERLHIIGQETLRLLRKEASRHPDLAATALAEAKAAREVLYRIFTGKADSQIESMDSQALRIFNAYLAEALSHRKISIEGQTFSEGWQVDEKDLNHPLHVYMVSAYQLLTGPQQAFIKQCAGCSWLFLDESKNHRRKWCDMQTCGSSEKAKRYYRRQKQSRQP